MFGFIFFESFLIVLFSIFFALKKSHLPKIKVASARLPLFDVMKGLAIFLIVALHASSIFSDNVFLLEVLWGAIPIFVFASGYLLAHRHKVIVWRPYLKNIFFRVVVIYLFFVIVTRFIFFSNLSFIEFFLDFFFGRTNGNFYFIPLLLQLYLLFPLLLRIKNFLRKPVVLAVVGLLSFAFHLLNFYSQVPLWNSNLWSLFFCGRFLFFFVLGIVFSDVDLSNISLKHFFIVLSLFIIEILFLSYFGHKLYLGFLWPVVMVLFTLIFANLLPLFLEKVFVSLGKHSLVIYLVHTRLVFNVFFLLPWHPLIVFVISLVGALGLSFFFSKFFMRMYANILKKINKKRF